MKLFLTVALLILSANVSADVPPVGSSLTNRLVIGSDQGDKIIPLPAGSWTVAHSGEEKGQGGPQLQGAMPNKYANVILVQSTGPSVKMILEVRTNTTSQVKLFSDQYCTSMNLIYQNKYDSGTWNQRCLEVNHSVGRLTSSAKQWVDLRSYLSKNNFTYPTPYIFFQSQEYNRHGQVLTVRLRLNPAIYGFVDASTDWTNSPWNRELILKDTLRSNFMTDFINFAQQYGNALHGSFIGGVAGPAPSFSPQGNSLPRPDASTSGATSNNPDANYHAKCVAIGFKINTSALEDCVKELKSRER